MTKRERQQLASIIDRLYSAASERQPIFANTRYWRARAAISNAHFKLSEMLHRAADTPKVTPNDR